jgi:hypothetical protein
MIQKKIVGIIFFIALISFVFGEGVFLLCRSHLFYPWSCNDFFLQIRGWFVLLSVPFLFISPVLFFVHREAFIAWAKFAVVAFPLMTGFILYTFYTPPSGAFFGINDNEVYPVPLIILFVLSSFILIAVKQWTLREK